MKTHATESRWVKIANERGFHLLVSIPANRAEYAAAAQDGGADAIKVHINCKHPASGKLFGDFRSEKKNLEDVLKSVSIPVGIVPGAEKRVAVVEELKELKGMGFDFFDIFAHHMPLGYLEVPVGRMVCVDSRYTPLQVKELAKCGAQVFEASIIPHGGYGKPAVFSDLAEWRALAENLDIPILVSTQRKILPEECRHLREAGIRGIVIGVVVTGKTAKGVYDVTRAFRRAIDEM